MNWMDLLLDLDGYSIIGTVAMLWVGGNIVVHGMDVLGWSWLYDQIHHAAEIAIAGIWR